MSRQRIFTRAERQGMIQMYTDGEPISAIIGKYKTGTTTFHRVREEEGVPKRSARQAYEIWLAAFRGDVQRKPPRKVEGIDHSGPPLGEQLREMERAERRAVVDSWRATHQEARLARATLPEGSRARIYATLEAADMAARLKIAQRLSA